MYFCLCKGLKDTDVLSLVEAGHETPRALISALGLRDPRCCGRCGQDVPRILSLVSEAPALTTAQHA